MFLVLIMCNLIFLTQRGYSVKYGFLRCISDFDFGVKRALERLENHSDNSMGRGSAPLTMNWHIICF